MGKYVSPETQEHAQSLLDLGLLYMNQDVSPEREHPAWVPAESFIHRYIPSMYNSTKKQAPDQYYKSDIGYLLEE